MDKQTFLELMQGLWAGAGRSKPPDQTTLRVWYLCLCDLTEAEFAAAIARYLQYHSTEFLAVQRIRELSGVQEAVEVAAIKAWDLVLAAISSVGGYVTPMFDDHVISHVVQHLGGWVALCDTEPTQLRQWTRQHFLKSYQSLSGRVAGPAELKNLLMSDQSIEVRRIEQQKALARLDKQLKSEALIKPVEASLLEPQFSIS